MGGNKAGSMKAVQTIYTRHGRDFFARAGRLGGLKSRGGGFAANHALAAIAGRKGGLKSRRGKAKKTDALRVQQTA